MGYRKGQRKGNQPRTIAYNPKALPNNYVELAEERMVKLSNRRRVVTTTQIRNFFSMFRNLENQLQIGDMNQEEMVNALNMIRVRLLYNAGRSNEVKEFFDATEVIQYLKTIKTKEEFINFVNYFESLVAFHRFYIGDR